MLVCTKHCIPVEWALALALAVALITAAIIIERQRDADRWKEEICESCDDSPMPPSRMDHLPVCSRIRCAICGDPMDNRPYRPVLAAYGYADYPRITEYPPDVRKYVDENYRRELEEKARNRPPPPPIPKPFVRTLRILPKPIYRRPVSVAKPQHGHNSRSTRQKYV